MSADPGLPASTTGASGVVPGASAAGADRPPSLRLPRPAEARAAALDRAQRLRDGALRLTSLLDRPLASYYLVLGCALLLLIEIGRAHV